MTVLDAHRRLTLKPEVNALAVPPGLLEELKLLSTLVGNNPSQTELVPLLGAL